MSGKSRFRFVAVLVVVTLLATTAQADIIYSTVSVGDPDNVGELSGGGGYGPERICGAVDYLYDIGKYEVTAGQYTDFLNAVATTDTYGLYAGFMNSSLYGCKIERSGSPGGYSYSVAADWANRPVNYVSWGDATRFCNWLHNGQPVGMQDLSTTEDGAYFLNGAIFNEDLLAVSREADWKYAIPTEDEWYKAAYYDPEKPGGADYWDYPTKCDLPNMPSNDLDGGGNNATFYDGDYTIGVPYYRTQVGEHVNSESAYGTFDQGGNVCEWNEAILYDSYRSRRGGDWDYGCLDQIALLRISTSPAEEDYYIGFRVSRIFDPVPGDANRDSFVNEADAAILATHWQTLSGATWAMGDFNGDYAVNDIDATIMAVNWQSGASGAVPEPGTLTLLAICGLTLLGLGARRRKR